MFTKLIVLLLLFNQITLTVKIMVITQLCTANSIVLTFKVLRVYLFFLVLKSLAFTQVFLN